MKDITGAKIERYQIVRELGQGGMAVVYRGTDTMLDRNVAVKMILSEGNSPEKTEKLLKRFHRESRILAGLSHPNIVKVLDFGDYEGTPYLVMEFISGGSLRSRMGKPIPYAQAAAQLVPLARALQYAHQQKVVHRDVKPENILINESDQPMLSDFGILKLVDLEESHGLTGTGKIVGTPAYMSPEQIRGREVDGRADMYSLGIVFFEMVTGRKPYNANTPIELSMQHLHDPIPKAKQYVRDLPAEVDQVIAKSIAKNPEDRYPSMTAFAQSLEKLSGTVVSITTSERRALKAAEEKRQAEKRKRAENKPRRNLTPMYGIVAALVLLLGAGYAFRQQLGFGASNTPAPIVPTATVPPTQQPVTPSALPEVEFTVTPASETPADTSTAAVVDLRVITPGNVVRVGQMDRIDKISVNRMDWIETDHWLVNAGTNAVFFINVSDKTKNQKLTVDGIPLSMAVSGDKIYILFTGNIKVIDIGSMSVVQTISPIAGGATSIAASPDGDFLALGISDNKTQILNAQDGSVVRTLKSKYGGWAVVFSIDSQYVVSGTSQGILKWETKTGIWQPTSGGQDVAIKTLVVSHDGKMLAGGGNGVLYLWNLEDGSLLQEKKGPFGMVNSIDFSPDDSMLVTGMSDKLIRIWEVSSATVLKELQGHSDEVTGVCFSPDGHHIASGAKNDASIRIWSLP
jgi:eukaryotic-like serine/threonine-protein kinase